MTTGNNKPALGSHWWQLIAHKHDMNDKSKGVYYKVHWFTVVSYEEDEDGFGCWCIKGLALPHGVELNTREAAQSASEWYFLSEFSTKETPSDLFKTEKAAWQALALSSSKELAKVALAFQEATNALNVIEEQEETENES